MVVVSLLVPRLQLHPEPVGQDRLVQLDLLDHLLVLALEAADGVGQRDDPLLDGDVADHVAAVEAGEKAGAEANRGRVRAAVKRLQDRQSVGLVVLDWVVPVAIERSVEAEDRRQIAQPLCAQAGGQARDRHEIVGGVDREAVGREVAGLLRRGRVLQAVEVALRKLNDVVVVPLVECETQAPTGLRPLRCRGRHRGADRQDERRQPDAAGPRSPGRRVHGLLHPVEVRHTVAVGADVGEGGGPGDRE